MNFMHHFSCERLTPTVPYMSSLAFVVPEINLDIF